MISFRKPARGRINKDKTLRFTFDGTDYWGKQGDTLASALLANGVHFVGRSFKYHRPRGIMAAGCEEANALVAFDRGPGRMTPNMRATTLELFDGLAARSQNHWPSLRYDVTALNDAASMFFPAGFYNKTFMWPKAFWDHVYEPVIRRTAGLGPAPAEPDKDHYASCYGHCEVLIAGAGPAGIAAALAASTDERARVILADEQNELGGDLLSSPGLDIGGTPAWDWLATALATLRARSNVRLMPRTTVIGYYHDNFLGLCERLTDHLPDRDVAPGAGSPRERLHRIRAGRVILATGAIERPLVFADNDRPGIMLCSAARSYLNRYGVAVGEAVSVLTSHDSAYQAAFDLSDANIHIGAIIDVRADVNLSLLALAEKRGIEVRLSSVVTGTAGRKRIRSIDVARVKDGVAAARSNTIACDALLMSGGWTPSVHLFSHSKGAMNWRGDIGAYVPGAPNEVTSCVGACTGAFTLVEALEQGSLAGGAPQSFQSNELSCTSGLVVAALPSRKDETKIKAFVDFQNDVCAKDIKLALREGFRSIEHVKRYTTNGMATDQGKTSNLNALQIAATATAAPVPDIGLTTFRPPFTPTTFGCLVGHNDGALFDVTRRTPIDEWAQSQGAVYEPVSLWQRARYFPRGGETMAQAVTRECKATRNSLGIFDASTLGKIEITGNDAATFMNRMYTNAWSKLAPGRCRYGLMLGEDGYIMDDGVIGRLAQDRFHVTTTTGGAPRVLAMMEDYLQTEWPGLDVWLTSVTEQWAVIALNGPKARQLIAPFVEDIDLSPTAFPHMAVRTGRICGAQTRLFRVSFSGELGFEINVPSHYGKALWEILFKAGQRFDITPYGTEAMHVLRAEKGFIIVGQDTDGTVTPDDAGMSWAIGKKKKDFVGKRSLARPDLVAKGRKQLVGLLTANRDVVLEEGAQIVADAGQPIPMDMLGHVTSSYMSPSLGRSIAMALVKDGRALMGTTLFVPMPDGAHEVVVSSALFYDPEGGRLNVE